MKNDTELNKELERLGTLENDWDGYGAVAPNQTALNLASGLIDSARAHNLIPSLVDADVMGGVAVWFSEHEGDSVLPQKQVWVSCFNTGGTAVVFKSRDITEHRHTEVLTVETTARIRAFLSTAGLDTLGVYRDGNER